MNSNKFQRSLDSFLIKRLFVLFSSICFGISRYHATPELVFCLEHVRVLFVSGFQIHIVWENSWCNPSKKDVKGLLLCWFKIRRLQNVKNRGFNIPLNW